MVSRRCTRIDLYVLCHHFHLDPTARPVIQRERNHRAERSKIIEAKIDILKDTKFIIKVHHSDWLTNFVLVQKKNRKSKVYVHVTNLNKVCPNDPYPLPWIDLFVDSSAGHKLLSFMDAYSRHSLINMYKPNKEAISLFVDWGTYCYKVMPFRLSTQGNVTMTRQSNL